MVFLIIIWFGGTTYGTATYGGPWLYTSCIDAAALQQQHQWQHLHYFKKKKAKSSREFCVVLLLGGKIDSLVS